MAASMHPLTWLRIRSVTGLFGPLYRSHRNLCSESDKSIPEPLEKTSDRAVTQEVKGFLKAQAILESKVTQFDFELEFETQSQSQSQTDIDKDNQNSISSSTRLNHYLAQRQKKTFAELLEDSPLTRLGSPEGALVKGQIVKRVQDDIYVEFNGKFCCVCKVPSPSPFEKVPSKSVKTASVYQKGKTVIVKLRDYEMTARFMGYDKDMTLLEADAELVGVASP